MAFDALKLTIGRRHGLDSVPWGLRLASDTVEFAVVAAVGWCHAGLSHKREDSRWVWVGFVISAAVLIIGMAAVEREVAQRFFYQRELSGVFLVFPYFAGWAVLSPIDWKDGWIQREGGRVELHPVPLFHSTTRYDGSSAVPDSPPQTTDEFWTRLEPKA